MGALFLHVLNLSITAGWIVLAVVLLRLCLKRAPRWITCLLWGLVALRLMLPFSIESALSLIPSAQTVPSDIISADVPFIDSGVTIIDRPVNNLLQTVVPSQPVMPPTDTPSTPSDELSVPIMEQVASIAAWVWLGGVVLMLLYELISVWRLRRQVLDAIYLGDNLWRTDRVQSPFILGLFRPRIYLPCGLDEETTSHVLAHERAHLRRRDHYVKPFAFTLLAVYWFNPLLWVAYILLCRDIEIACDQRVIRDLSAPERRQYATALLNCGVERRTIAACPLAFGEVGIKQRIRSALHYRKPLLWVIVASLILCSVAAVCLLTVPKDSIEVFSRQNIEPNQSRQYYGTDTDGSLPDGGLDWLWEHAENPDDHKDATSMPLVLSHSRDELNELVRALEDPLQSGMEYWFDFDEYDDAYFEDRALLWLCIPGNDSGEYQYTVSLEETNKGLRYSVSLSRLATTLFGGLPTRCQNLLLFEVERSTIDGVDGLMTRYEWVAPVVPSDENVDYVTLGHADMDGDGKQDSITMCRVAQKGCHIVVRKADGTPILNEMYGGFDYDQCYLVPRENEPPYLLLVERDSYYNSEGYGVLSLKDGVRTVVDRSIDGGKPAGSPLQFETLIPYIQSLSAWLEDAQLLCETSQDTHFYGDTIGSAQYKPLSWLDVYRQDEDDTLQEILENILVDYDVATTPVGEIDFDGDGRKESLSAVWYLTTNSGRYSVIVRNTAGDILTGFDIYHYLSDENFANALNNYTVYLYKVKSSDGREQLIQVQRQRDGVCNVYSLTNKGSDYLDTMTMTEWMDELQDKQGDLLFYIQDRELVTDDTSGAIPAYASLYKDIDASELTEQQVRQLATELVNRQIDIWFLFQLDIGRIDQSVTCPLDENYVLCTDVRFTCVQDIKDYIREGLTEEAAQWWITTRLDVTDDPPYYIDYEEKLWRSTYAEGQGWSMTYLTETSRVISRTETSVTVEMDTLYFGEEDTWKYTPTLVKTDAGWRLANADFGAGYDRVEPSPYATLLNSEYRERDVSYAAYDMNGDGTEELLVREWPRLYVYTLQAGQPQLVVEEEFSSGTSRFLLTQDPDYPGLVYFCVGGGKERYYYLSLDRVENKAFVHTPLWTDNYADYDEGDPGRITELTEDKKLIELSRTAYQNNRDIHWNNIAT